jgi:hypothetical protein
LNKKPVDFPEEVHSANEKNDSSSGRRAMSPESQNGVIFWRGCGCN